MAQKKRYLIGSRVSPQVSPQDLENIKSFVNDSDTAEVVKETPVGRQVVEMTDEEMREFAAAHPHLVVEEDPELDLYPMPGLPEVVNLGQNFSRVFVVQDATNGKPVADATIFGIGDGPAYKAVTDASGRAQLLTNEALLKRVIVSPRDTYWSRLIENISVTDASDVNVTLKPLLVTGAYSWGHRLMNFAPVNNYWTGRGVKVAIIDSGISDKLQDIRPVGGYNTLDGQDANSWNVDEKGHGSHCAGIVSALANAVGVRGAAPDAEIYSVKVFPGGFASDLVEAVEWCIANRMDVISMSLGSRKLSQVLADTLRDAYERGITCVAASGNDSTAVAFPAALPTVIAVGAIGRYGTFPEDSAHGLKVGDHQDWTGKLFSANFTNFGPEIDFCGPGVAILSTVPSGYVAWDGTSFACPLITGLVALILEVSPEFRTGDSRQPEYVKSILQSSAANLGMPPHIQGAGLPLANQALAVIQSFQTQAYSYWGAQGSQFMF
jgi:subtilisin family serine protease